MIDFGLAKKYVGENGKHNEKQKENDIKKKKRITFHIIYSTS